MKSQQLLQPLTLLCATALTVACGGSYGGGGTQVAGIDRTDTPGFSIAFGTVTGFGSIIVNGVRYDTSASSFTIDGAPGSQDDIAVGDVVLVRGTIASSGTNGTANAVIFNDNVEGPISSIDVVAGALVVLGQTVRTNADTSFDDSVSPPALAGLGVGEVVEVSGFTNADGSIVATRIEPMAPGGLFEVTGIASAHDAAAMTFAINGLVVDYSTATSIRDFPGGAISDGDLLEAKGTTISTGGELIATEVEFKGNQIAGNADDHVEIEGLITRFASAADFDVSGVAVTTNAQTVFEGDMSSLGLNVKVEVEGELDSSNVLVATKVDVRRVRVVRIEAAVDSVDASANTFVTLGITIEVDAITRMEDKLADLEPFSLADLNPDEFVRMRGSFQPGTGADVIATLLERDDPRDTELQGLVETSSSPALTILGVTIETDNSTVFRNVDDMAISANDFFTQVHAGDLVKATGTETGPSTILADEVEFESAL